MNGKGHWFKWLGLVLYLQIIMQEEVGENVNQHLVRGKFWTWQDMNPS